MDRARIYVGYAQFIVTILVMLKVYEDTRFGHWFFSHWWTFAGFFVMFFAGLIVIGYLDKRYIRPHEISEINSTNPELMEILKILKNDK